MVYKVLGRRCRNPMCKSMRTDYLGSVRRDGWKRAYARWFCRDCGHIWMPSFPKRMG